MNVSPWIGRIAIYSALIGIGVYVFKLSGWTASGEIASKIFVSFSVVFGVIQSFNLKTIKKVTDLQKTTGLGFWARWRLNSRLELRWAPVVNRAIFGIVSSVLAGLIGGFMWVYGEAEVPYYLMGLSASLIFISLVMLGLTLYEFVILSKLETRLHQESENNDKKASAIASIRGDSQNDP